MIFMFASAIGAISHRKRIELLEQHVSILQEAAQSNYEAAIECYDRELEEAWRGY